jgi:hypothetical protein
MRPSSARWHGRNPRDAAPKAPKPEANAIGTAVRNPASILFFVHNKGCAKEGRDCLQLKGKMLGLTLIHLDLSRRLSIRMAEGNAECISRLTFFLSSKIDADQIKITNDFPLHHD